MGMGEITYEDAPYDDGEEEHDSSPFAIMCLIIFCVIAVVVLAITAGLYFGLHHLDLGQYYYSLHWLEFIIPAIFLIACCLASFFYYWRNCQAEKGIEDIPGAIADALLDFGRLEITFGRKAAMSDIYLLTIMAEMGEIELGDGNVHRATLENFAREGKWCKKFDRTVEIILTGQFSRKGREADNSKSLAERLTGNIERIEVI